MVYLVTQHNPYDASWILGIFSSLELAKNSVENSEGWKYCTGDWAHYDDGNEGEISVLTDEGSINILPLKIDKISCHFV